MVVVAATAVADCKCRNDPARLGLRSGVGLFKFGGGGGVERPGIGSIGSGHLSPLCWPRFLLLLRCINQKSNKQIKERGLTFLLFVHVF